MFHQDLYFIGREKGRKNGERCRWTEWRRRNKGQWWWNKRGSERSSEEYQGGNPLASGKVEAGIAIPRTEGVPVFEICNKRYCVADKKGKRDNLGIIFHTNWQSVSGMYSWKLFSQCALTVKWEIVLPIDVFWKRILYRNINLHQQYAFTDLFSGIFRCMTENIT